MMRHSIRLKFTFILTAIMAISLLAICILNTFFLEIFYRREKVREIKTAYASINAAIKEKKIYMDENSIQIWVDDEVKALLDEYTNKYNISIALINSLDSSAIISSEKDTNELYKRIQSGIFAVNQDKQMEVIYEGDHYVISNHVANDSTFSYIEFMGYCTDNQTIVLMSTPVASLESSVAIANQFLIYIGCMAFIINLSVVYFMTRRITSPILNLADISERICNFDFSVKYDGEADDEIGKLGKNMNHMSDRLKTTIEELRAANASLKDDIKRKEEIEEARTAFIANVSHELKTPLALIQGYAEGLQEGLCEDEANRSYYTGVIIDEAEKMNYMVKQLLTLSSIESGDTILTKSGFSINELIRGILNSSQILVNDKNVELSLDTAEDIRVYADEFKIEEVVTNYISNAIHHVTEEGEIRVGLVVKGNVVRVVVFNTGVGIPDEDIAHIWDKFYKVDKAHSRFYRGSGVGLSIVKAIVEAHSMEYGAQNVDGGVEFWFELPIYESCVIAIEGNQIELTV